MSIKDNGGQAFPTFTEQYHYGIGEKQLVTVQGGMTLRDYFAAKALSAILLGGMNIKGSEGAEIMRIAPATAYEYADLMLKARTA